MTVTLKRNGWGADCVDASAGPLEVMESSLGLLRFRTSPKPYSDKDKRNPREAQGGAADVKPPQLRLASVCWSVRILLGKAFP